MTRAERHTELERASEGRVNLTGARVGVLVNTSSGSCAEGIEGELLHELAVAGLTPTRCWCGDGHQVEAALGEAGTQRLDVLIVLGGDGTIRAAAEQCSGTGRYLLPLPGGTMNVLPKALYDERSWREALRDTLRNPVGRPLHGGSIGERHFFISALIGGPSRLADAREEIREGHLGLAIEKGAAALAGVLSTHLNYKFGRAQGCAKTVAILCPLASRDLEVTEECFEAIAVQVDSVLDVLKLGLTAVLRDWREDPSIVSIKSRRVGLSSSEPITAMLDGETFEFPARLEVRLRPNALVALRPGRR